MHYCDYTATLPPDNPHRRYHDHEYGFPIAEDDRLFERLVFEINQAGLSWTTILNKADNLRRAYDHFGRIGQKRSYLGGPCVYRTKKELSIVRHGEIILYKLDFILSFHPVMTPQFAL
ncbi:DNA-3-methyladenine glycosylase I [Cardiobacterium sp. Marseille-Q4385]|uniref:DNA-3-methyladenine glycosylase I n=1 Tax=Cardiobacterium sp. Marseille-Q4385 TaxID=2866573 RepID=UPI001CE3D71B|nr:DNA-3-methyladenine glycosylase I [Cardiobacterium sp. Marseille-Q4385]